LRRLLLRIGYRLPEFLQRPFHRYLYDDPPPAPQDENARLVVTAVEPSDAPVRFEVLGGCRDGEVVEGLLANPFYWQSKHGRLGARFKVASSASVDAFLAGEPTGPILHHEYEIVENRLENGIRYVRAEAR
jgi:hypothetical protein